MSLHVNIIAPDRNVWDSNAEEVILPSSTGQLGILKGHAPLLTALYHRGQSNCFVNHKSKNQSS